MLKAEILGVYPEAATEVEVIQPYNRADDPACQALWEKLEGEEVATLLKHAVIQMDVRLHTITSHCILSRLGDGDASEEGHEKSSLRGTDLEALHLGGCTQSSMPKKLRVGWRYRSVGDTEGGVLPLP